MKMKSSVMITIIVGVIIVLGVSVTALYYINESSHHASDQPSLMRMMNRNVTVSEDEQNAVNSFFSTKPGAMEVTTYCQDHRAGCFSYCRMHQDESSCSMMFSNRTRMGMGMYNRSRNGMGGMKWNQSSN